VWMGPYYKQVIRFNFDGGVCLFACKRCYCRCINVIARVVRINSVDV
jgi:hypothetical protein